MKTLPLLLAATLCAGAAAAQPRLGQGPIWTCTMRGVLEAPPQRAPSRFSFFAFTSSTRNLAEFGAGRACRNASPARTVPGSCALVGCRLVRP